MADPAWGLRAELSQDVRCWAEEASGSCELCWALAALGLNHVLRTEQLRLGCWSGAEGREATLQGQAQDSPCQVLPTPERGGQRPKHRELTVP